MSSERESLSRAIGTFGLAAGIVNITIGGGIFRLPAVVAGSLGAAAPIGYVVCALAMGLIVWCMAWAGRRVPTTGGLYAYVGVALGPYAGFLSGVLLWMTGTFAFAAVATIFATSLGQLVPALAGTFIESVMLIVTFAFWTLVNLGGVALGVRLNSIATVAKLAPLLLLAGAGVLFINPEHLVITAMPGPASIARVSMVLIFAFAGIECALLPSGEVRDSERTIPRAIAMAMITITALYIALQVVTKGILGDQLPGSTVAPLAEAAGQSLGGWAKSLLLAGAAISMFGYIGGMSLSVPRITYALARDGFLPAALARIDPVRRVPTTAIVCHALLAVTLALSGTFEKLAVLANASALILYLGCSVAAWRLGQPPAVPALACGVILWLLSGLTADEWAATALCIAVVSALYGVRTRTTRLAS